MKKAEILLLLLLVGMGEWLKADNPLQVAIAEHQISIMNNIAYAKGLEPTNQVRTISFGAIMAAREEGYSNQEIFESASRTNDPRFPQLSELGYRLNENIINYLSSTNNIAAKTAPTPGSAEDLQKREALEAAAKAPPKPAETVDDRKEMLRIYNEAVRMQQKAEMKALERPQ